MFVMPGGVVAGIRRLRSRFYVVAPAPVVAVAPPDRHEPDPTE